MDQAVFDEIYTKNFPATEAVPVDTITAAMSARQKDGTHLDGKRFTLCYSGVLPGESEDKRRPIAFAQGGTLDAGPEGVVSFAEYLAVNDEFRGHGMLHVMLGFVNATSMAAVAKENQTTGANKTLLGSVWEIDPKGRGDSAKDRLYTPVRNAIYDRAGAFVVMGRDQEGQLHPVHAQPDVTPDGDCGDWHLHFVYRPQNPEHVQFDKAKLLAVSRGYDSYFADWAATGKRGVNAQTIASAADYKHALHRRFDEVSLIQPSKAPADWDMARGDALIAKIVAEDFGLSHPDGKAYEELDYFDPAIRNSIADRAAAGFEQERLDARAAAEATQ
ncbi:hypothetical protein LJR230_005100 [Trinickia sp. LjRoot230]|uniref:hypothetical protein n=1 Tax=Trinickia sp. LjRoot230 TaxID=3342288 RepID=UPI003ECFC401